MDSEIKKDFQSLGLNEDIISTVKSLGYENPTPIQQYAIPYVLSGRDVLGQAQTGTGKTAAFALPLINNMDLSSNSRLPQVLVLAPTRELAIQVAEQFEAFSKRIPNLEVVSIYGGQEYGGQIRALKEGVQVVVGTAGRVMDHIKKGTLKLEGLKTLVLDEADEMLRMGFIDDVKWVLSHIDDSCQRLLFSATIPSDIANIIKEHLRNPCKIQVKSKTETANTITQKFIVIKGFKKIDALDRILETEETDGVIIFVKTKTSTIEVADNLKALGYKVAAINGDMQQNQREYIIEQFKNGNSSILVATDVVARGIDLERISHVINYDMPNDTDSYVHRIGRTGRAGRDGVSIALVPLKEMGFLRVVERATRSKLEEIFMPTAQELSAGRIEKFKARVLGAVEKNTSLEKYRDAILEIKEETGLETETLLAALTLIAQGNKTFFPREIQAKQEKERSPRERKPRDRGENNSRFESKQDRKPRKSRVPSDINLSTYRVDVGRDNDIAPRNIVGAIANEGGIDSKYICNISIQKDHTLVDLPANLPPKVINHLKKIWVAGKKLNISQIN
ncbi:DEAD/DEAH box helicase [Francisella frigiditurris]|uniref:ATP-dependent RNA helicase DeaD n=1 Tax=Francisella frigiditurris TaxID=1542390 RepID=A0A1J0KTR0_9GAMM|nr:DEAD/DEAH box helicase [Francisella frigiditurris]APC97168.1 hypothetical protein KX01_1435 [Francisella frigiditurris]